MQVSRSARSRPGEFESELLCSLHPCLWAGHGAVVLLPRGRRTCAAPRSPRRLSGTRKAGEQGCSPAGALCQAASPRTHLSGSHCRCEVYPAVGPRLWRQRVPRCQSSSRGLTRFLLTNSAPLRPRALPLPLKLSARCLTLQAEAAGIFLSVQCSPGCLANPALRWMLGKGTGARSSGRGVGAGIRSLPPPGAALSAAANVGFLVRFLLRYRTPAPGTLRPPV